jgi:hypothetical protein
MTLRALSVAVLAVVLAAVSASAHHSFAMFDASKTLTISGAVTSFQWTNPHSWLDIAVKNKQGQTEKWSFEMVGPANLARQGLKPKSILPGDKVTLTYHPMKDGTLGGQFLTARFAKGLTVSEGAEPPRARANPY